jgi:two-component system, chemotaxis family, protein-glutamate methylesterase/glutaminase
VKKIKVHVIDDSASVRMALTELLNTDPGIEVIDSSSDPIIARGKLDTRWPDIFILDIEMPRMDGITFLKEIMETRPTPVIICSSLTRDNEEITMQTLSAGAVDVISKPDVGIKEFLYESAITLVDTVKSASQAKVKKFSFYERMSTGPVHGADVIAGPAGTMPGRNKHNAIIAIGASAGGTKALEVVLKDLSLDMPGIVIVQHMPEKFTKAYADRLNGLCSIHVEEAVDGMAITDGSALIAPGNRHLLIKKKRDGYEAVVKDGPLVNRHRPSVDVLFRSAANVAGGDALGIILTGMGDDGARGMLEMHKAGAYTIAQDEETSVVYGMPREAFKCGGVDEVAPLEGMSAIIRKFGKGELVK